MGQVIRANFNERRILDLRVATKVDFARRRPAVDFEQTVNAKRVAPETCESEQVTDAAR